MRTRLSWTIVVATIAAAAVLLLPGVGGSAAAASTSQIYVVHGIPGVPVDVYVNGKLQLPDFLPSTVAGPLALPAGDYQIQVFAHVASPPTDAPSSGAVIDKTETVPGGISASIVANLDAGGNPTLNVFVNKLDPLAAGKARVSVRHTAAAPAVDIYVDGAKAISSLTNPNEAVAEIPTGSHEIAVKLAGTATTVIGPATLTFAPNTNTAVYAIGSAEAKSLAVVVQVLDTTPPTVTTVAPTTTVAPSTTVAPAAPAPAVAAQPTFTG